jgi:hypothetical protein
MEADGLLRERVLRRGQVFPCRYLEMKCVALRKVPGCLALGLSASLAAHAALYGGEHAIGGAYHALLVQIALAAALGFVGLVGALAWTQSGNSTDGSVLAARLRDRLPGLGSIIAAATACYAGVETVEPHHAGVSGIALLAALAVASYAALRLAHAITDAFARAVIAISRTSFSPRAPAWNRRPRGRLIPRRSFLTRRRFARPPPIAFALPRA